MKGGTSLQVTTTSAAEAPPNAPPAAAAVEGPPAAVEAPPNAPPAAAAAVEAHLLDDVIQRLRKHRRVLFRQLRDGTQFDPVVVAVVLDIANKASGMPWPVGLAVQAIVFLGNNGLQAYENATTAEGSLASMVEEIEPKLKRLRDLGVPDEHQDKMMQITKNLVVASAFVHNMRRTSRWTFGACLHAFVCAKCNAKKILDVKAGLEKLVFSIRDIVSEIAVDRIERPSNKPPELPYHLVGMEEPLLKVMKFLEDSGGSSTRVVGLHGEGGIGKTTLMSAVEAKHRSGTIYKIASVEVGMQRPPGFTDLQKRMYSQLTSGSNQSFASAAQGRAELKVLFESLKHQNKKICVFLDNVWEYEDLVELLPGRDYLADALPPGSNLLISSRSADVAAKLADMCFKSEREKGEGYLDYQLLMLQEKDAQDLFLLKASKEGEEKPLQRDDPLVQEIVSKCGGLPLALAVYGSYFRDEKMRKPDMWKRVVKQLQRAEDLHSGEARVFQKLRDSVSFQPERLQDAFVDVALFFRGQFFDEVKLAMEEEDDLDRLMDQSLVIRRGERVEVHDLFLVVAKQMAKEKNISFVTDDTGEDEIAELLPHPHLSSQVPFIRGFDEERWCRYAENKYPSSAQIQDVRYLKLRKAAEEFSLIITKHCHKVRTLELQVEDELQGSWIANLKHLKVLSLLGMKVDIFAGISKISSQLRVFNWGRSSKFTCSNNLLEASFTTLRHLQIPFKDDKLPKWVSQLGSLTQLDLSGCTSLVQLPGELGQLGSLTGLNLRECTSLVQLPGELGQLGSLTWLGLSGCTSLVQLPGELGQLGSLTQLDLSGCTSLVQLPGELGQLGSLTGLDLSGCTSLVQLPGSWAPWRA